MSSRIFSGDKTTYRGAVTGQKVVLNDDYLVENNKALQMEAVFLRTVQNAENHAAEIIAKAQAEAEALIQAAEARAAQIVQEQGESVIQRGFDEGFQTGLEKGFEAISTELADRITLADSILEKAYDAEKRLVLEHQEQILALVTMIVKRVLTQELQTAPYQIIELIEDAANHLDYNSAAKIRINPETYRMIQESSPQSAQALATTHRMQLVPDPSLQPLDVILESAEISLELSPMAQADTYLARVAQKMQWDEFAKRDVLPAEKPAHIGVQAEAPVIHLEDLGVSREVPRPQPSVETQAATNSVQPAQPDPTEVFLAAQDEHLFEEGLQTLDEGSRADSPAPLPVLSESLPDDLVDERDTLGVELTPASDIPDLPELPESPAVEFDPDSLNEDDVLGALGADIDPTQAASGEVSINLMSFEGNTKMAKLDFGIDDDLDLPEALSEKSDDTPHGGS